jgi:hypothetical protein
LRDLARAFGFVRFDLAFALVLAFAGPPRFFAFTAVAPVETIRTYSTLSCKTSRRVKPLAQFAARATNRARDTQNRETEQERETVGVTL